ncbi:hypothetical protein [Halopiger djelfimassiliensis]|uniref:hypothetical protein n=1 Tax=Halopiger djelfimassiliensis TaxID=1293047 RepID=UPI000677E38F|nr:hypothetical protein [Halopiger djelfimassiliensis]
MSSQPELPGTAIEWYMFGAALVGASVIGLLVTGHTLPQSLVMGVTTGLGVSLLVVLVTAAWHTLRA